MPCELCKTSNNDRVECTHQNIVNIIVELLKLADSVYYSQNININVNIIYNEFESIIKELPICILTQIIRNISFFQSDHGFGDSCDNRIILEGKINYIIMSNARRCYPTEFYKLSHKSSEEIFRRQIYWHSIANGDSDNCANDLAEMSANITDELYRDLYKIIYLDITQTINSVLHGKTKLAIYDLNIEGSYTSLSSQEIVYIKQQILQNKKNAYHNRIIFEWVEPTIVHFILDFGKIHV